MQARGRLVVAAPGDASGMLVSRGCSLATSRHKHTQGIKRSSDNQPSNACITPLALAHPLLTAPYLSPAAAYTLLASRVQAWKWDAPLKPLMTWLRAIIVEEPTRHIRVLWRIEKLPYSYANKTALDGCIVAFSRDIVAGNTPPTITVNEEWWETEELQVPTETVANSEVAKLQPRDTSIPKASNGAATINLPPPASNLSHLRTLY